MTAKKVVISPSKSKGKKLTAIFYDKDNKKINPLNFYYGNLSQKEFDALLTQSRQENQSMD